MNDLISRQAAIDALGERPTVWTSSDEYALGERNQYDCDRLAIETVPPTDAVPVKHGDWVVKHFDTEGNGVNIPFCTVCGKPNRFPQKTAFCPNCGSRMDGGKDDAE